MLGVELRVMQEMSWYLDYDLGTGSLPGAISATQIINSEELNPSMSLHATWLRSALNRVE